MSDFKGLQRQTLSDSVYEQLRNAILVGDIPDGEELNQVTLAKQFDVSRVPVREALRRLQAEHLVTGSPYQQYVVTGVAPDALLDLRIELEVFAVRRSMHLSHLSRDIVACRGFRWSGSDAAGLVVAGGVEGELAEELSGFGVDDADVAVCGEQDHPGAGVGLADPDVVQAAVVPEGD